mmetsp:Transcript_1472/g.4386  ORF Transcript_1472/g.4386 Transcript_1472/m.4386 type:complete len:236 (+) Transcript_1472:182-889(+)
MSGLASASLARVSTTLMDMFSSPRWRTTWASPSRPSCPSIAAGPAQVTRATFRFPTGCCRPKTCGTRIARATRTTSTFLCSPMRRQSSPAALLSRSTPSSCLPLHRRFPTTSAPPSWRSWWAWDPLARCGTPRTRRPSGPSAASARCSATISMRCSRSQQRLRPPVTRTGAMVARITRAPTAPSRPPRLDSGVLAPTTMPLTTASSSCSGTPRPFSTTGTVCCPQRARRSLRPCA